MPIEAPASSPRKSSWLRAYLPPIAAAILLVVAIQNSFRWQTVGLLQSHNQVYRFGRNAWRALPELPGNPTMLQVSSEGTVWVLFWQIGAGDELARLNGSAWRIYQARDFGVQTSNIESFVLDGEEVWADESEGVLHWDGQHWQRYSEPATTNLSAIAAARGEAWDLDVTGKLSHFDGRRWTAQATEMPGPKTTGGNLDDESPQLAATRDGSLWLVRSGLWQWDGSRWAAANPGGEDFHDAWLTGAAGDAIWLVNGASVESVSRDKVVRRFIRQQMGWLKGEHGYDIADADGRIDVATSRGILEFDGASWRRLPPPANTVRSVIAVRRAEGGDLFAIGTIPSPFGRWRRVVTLLPLLLVLGLLAVIVWLVRINKRRRLDDHQRLQEAVVHATGATPDEFVRDERLLVKQSSWWSATATVGVIVVAGAAYSITRIFWPHVPSWMFLVMALVIHVLAMLGQTLIQRTPKPWDPIEPGGPRFDWGPTRSALPASLAVFVLMNLGSFPKWMGDPVLWILYPIAAMFWYKTLSAAIMVRVLNRGDYESALKWTRRIHFLNPRGGVALWRLSHVLLLAGRFPEAEEAARAALARLRSRWHQAHALEFLADALLEQGRPDEAMRSYEAALRAAPGFRRPYRGMAELVLRQGHDPARAMEHIEQIVAPRRASWTGWKMNGKGARDDYFSLKAWALAESGRGAEAEQAAREAIRHTNPKAAPDLSATYRRLGLAMQALGRQAEANEYWQKAIFSDPHGRWLLLAKAELARRHLSSASR